VPLLFAVTLFLSATLLFLVQPMIGKMILPLLGGTPAVWNTCMVFFQAALLAGYAYAHATPKWLGHRRQVALHALLLLVPFAVLPVAVANNWIPPTDSNPIPWLLGLLTLSIGLPFFVVATSAPLLQRWFAGTNHPTANDPYFLYAASNVGSMLALFGYPVLVEPFLPLADQGFYWTIGYALLVVLTLACAYVAYRNAAVTADPRVRAEPATAPPLARGTVLHWIGLAFIPSSLMLGVTTYFTTDIAAIPLLWVVPLGIYLLSFILVFARRQLLPYALMCRALPPTVLMLVFLLVSGSTHQLHTGMVMVLHLLALFVVSMVCHGELAKQRPAAAHLTAFFLCMSVGGVLGGMFNALLAPVVFTRVVEYPIAIVLACLMMPVAAPSAGTRKSLLLDVVLPALLGLFIVGVLLLLMGAESFLKQLPGSVSALLVYLVPLLVCFSFAGRPWRFGLGVAAILLASSLTQESQAQVLHRQRSFFGDLHLRHDADHRYMQMFHGTTLHGMQNLDSQTRREPLTYFHKTGPIGQLFATLTGPAAPKKVAVTGLGVGTLASYAEPGQSWTYYEIDPAVTHVADDPKYFTYLSDARKRGVKLDVVHGDARLQLKHAAKGEYDLLVLDAFSSDSVPVHLLTREALDLYLSKLAKNGRLVFNISNKYLRLEPVLAAVAQDAKLHGLVQHDLRPSTDPGKRESSWVVLAREPETLAELGKNPNWRPLKTEANIRMWKDDYSNILSILMW